MTTDDSDPTVRGSGEGRGGEDEEDNEVTADTRSAFADATRTGVAPRHERKLTDLP